MEAYNKAPLTYQQHVDLLKYRGLIINNPEEAENFLKQVNYYRFTAYCIPFQKPHDVFITATTFEMITELYRLDEELRGVVFAALTPIEIFLRTRIAYELSHKWGAFAHYDLSIFHNEEEGKRCLAELEEATADSKEPFLQHYRNKYSGFPRLPLWMACEIMSLGDLSTFYSCLTRDVRLLICSIIGIDHNVFRTWLHTITFLRNVCAHHGRLWSRNFSISPMIPNKNPEWQGIKFNNKKLFTIIAILEWIRRKAELSFCNLEAVHDVMRKIANMDKRFTIWMGVPTGMKIEMIWKS